MAKQLKFTPDPAKVFKIADFGICEGRLVLPLSNGEWRPMAKGEQSLYLSHHEDLINALGNLTIYRTQTRSTFVIKSLHRFGHADPEWTAMSKTPEKPRRAKPEPIKVVAERGEALFDPEEFKQPDRSRQAAQ